MSYLIKGATIVAMAPLGTMVSLFKRRNRNSSGRSFIVCFF